MTDSGSISTRRSERKLQVLGANLQKIMLRLGENQRLLRYLYYEDKDPLNKDHANVDFSDIFKKQIKIIPIIGNIEDAKSIISMRVLSGTVIKGSSEFMDISLNIEVFVPTTQWILKGDNLRPFLIMGEICKSLDGKEVKGMGKMNFDNFSINFLTEEMSAYQMMFSFTQFN